MADEEEERPRRRRTVYIRIGDPTMMTQEQRDEFWRRVQEHEGPGRPVRPAGKSAFEPEDPPLPSDSYGLVKALRAEWERSAAIRDEFESFERFLAFRRAEAKGLVKILAPGRRA